MDPALTLRAATLADVPTIIAQRRAMFEAMGFVNRAELDLTDGDFEDWIRKALAEDEYYGWLITDQEGKSIGGAGLWITEWPPHPHDRSTRRAMIMNVHIDPAFERLGLRRRLINQLLDWCRDQGIRTVTLQAMDQNRDLYQSLGFRPTDEMLIRVSVPD